MGILDSLLTKLNESLVIDSTKCSRIRHKNSGCDKCISVCVQNAIEITRAGGKVLVDWERCSACGECLAVCPNDVFSLKLAENERIFSAMKECIALKGEMVFTCVKNVDEAYVFLPSLCHANRKLLLKAALFGAEKIKLIHGDCEPCRYSGCLQTLEREKRAAEAIFRLAGTDTEIDILSAGSGSRKAASRLRQAEGPALSRREFFGFIGSRTKDSVGKTIYSLSENDGQKRKTKLNEKDAEESSYITGLKRLGGDDICGKLRAEGLLPSVAIDMSKCSLCGVCVRMCPSGVFYACHESVKGKQTVVDIGINKDMCSGCGVCILSCMSKAISIRETAF